MEQKENKEVIMPPLWEKIATWTTHYLHISAPVKIWYYAITMLLLSLVQDFVDVPHLEELTGKRSFFNMVRIILCILFSCISILVLKDNTLDIWFRWYVI